MSIKKFETTWAGKSLIVEIGEIAKQANGSALIYYGDTVVLSTVCSKKSPATQDFFPLMVIYQEKQYAAGKIPGGFLRREGRPSELETLTSRVIDRPIRPLFPVGYNDDVQVVNTVVSSELDANAPMAAMLGSSISLGISNVPFLGPIAGVVVGRLNNEFIINPTPKQLEQCDIDLTVAGTKVAINMVEAGAKQVSEADMLAAILFGHNEIKRLINFQEEIIKAINPTKMEVLEKHICQETLNEVLEISGEKLVKAVSLFDKIEREDTIQTIKEETIAYFDNKIITKKVGELTVIDTTAKDALLKEVAKIVDEIVTKEVRRLITKEKIRPDGRKVDEIRPLTSRVDVLPRAHGSALFTRGQTQSLGVVTLGALAENQLIDGLGDLTSKRFMLHYNFPPFSVGETGRYGAPGRREIGHGALGERALLQVLPNEVEFPYAIRIVSEILESNGSSSQATICSGTMALMAAGVPIKAPVAGIAMGLIMEGTDYTILSDIQGMEDHEGDMDFKVAGSKEGITALQMDIKIEGITYEILEEALEQARKGRLHILEHMSTVIATSRPEVSTFAPKVKMITISPDKIKDIIGASGKIINKIIEENNNVKIDIQQDGRIYIMHSELKYVDSTITRIENLTKEAEVGKIYEGTVTRILMDKDGKKSVGAFVEIWPGCEGLVHISKLSSDRVEKVEDVVKVGDIILVKCIKIDDKGRVDLSRKDAI